MVPAKFFVLRGQRPTIGRPLHEEMGISQAAEIDSTYLPLFCYRQAVWLPIDFPSESIDTG
jgi:hypothetical protein